MKTKKKKAVESENQGINSGLEPSETVPNSEVETDKMKNAEESGGQMQSDQNQTSDGNIESRRSDAIEKLLEHDGIRSGESEQHNEWFQNLYDNANNDPASVPWADLKPNKEILKWLNENPGEDRQAVENGCGLGDNAEALAAVGWQVTAFDISEAAVSWAKSRFPDSQVLYRVLDLLNLPKKMQGKFDLVVDNHNIQAFVPGSLRQQAIESLTGLMSSNGQLLIGALYGNETDLDSGHPWPLTQKDLEYFKSQGLTMNMLRPSSTRIGNRLKAHILVGFVKKSDA